MLTGDAEGDGCAGSAADGGHVGDAPMTGLAEAQMPDTAGLRVEELADAAGIAVDTVRYYQRIRLLPAPRRAGRHALYGDSHLQRLREIRRLADDGFSLAQIKALSTPDATGLLAELAQADGADPELDKAELARRAEVPEFIVDVVIAAGLVTPVGEPGRERFRADAVDMLSAARTLVDSGFSLEELTALAMRHATHIEDVIDDALELFKRHLDRREHGRRGSPDGDPADNAEGDPAGGSASANAERSDAATSRDQAGRGELIELMERLVPVASSLVGAHFERTLRSRALARLSDQPPDAADEIVVEARRLQQRLDPVAVYLASEDHHRMLWARPDEGFAIAALGALETIEPHGQDRFSAASAARVALAARVRCEGPPEAPPPVLAGGFSFACRQPAADALPADGQSMPQDSQSRPDWEGYPEARWVLPEITLVDRSDGTWILAARRRPAGDTYDAAANGLAERIEALTAAAPPTLGSETSTAEAQEGQAHEAGAADENDTGCDAYTALVGDALAAIGHGRLGKVVLARILERGPVDLGALLARLTERYRSCALIAVGVGERHFIAASPEQLVALDGGDVRTVALAGTVGRSADPQADQRLGAEMLASAKARAEHRFVVDDITERLAGLGLVGETPAEPEVLRLARVQHLQTPITARIERRRGVSDMDVLRVAGVLHPTPAVAGTPTAAALDWIAEHEGFDRGWYAAPVGWCDLEGNGELRVALRSALIDPDRAWLFAGAGIVADSDPGDEFDETAVKLRALLDAMI